MDWGKAYKVLAEYVRDELGGIPDDHLLELEHEIQMCDHVYRILQGANMNTIAEALERLKKETGYGERHDQTKECESKRKKTAKLSERYTERVISKSA